MKASWFKKHSFDWPAPLHVLLLAAFPILFLFSYNINQMAVGQIMLPLAICMGGAILLWLLLALILRDGRKAGLSTGLFLVFFFSYGRLYQLLEAGHLAPAHGHAILLPGVLLAWGYCVYFISRANRDFRTTTTVINAIAIFLVIINIANIAIFQVTRPGSAAGTPAEQTAQVRALPGAANDMPDIYFIILDEYANPDANREWCGYDDSEFLKSLKDKGFFIADQSRTRSPHTPQAIAQVLNMEYLTGGWNWDAAKKNYVETPLPGAAKPADPPWSDPTYRKYADNQVEEFLKTKGYKYIYFGNWLGVDRWAIYMESVADQYFDYYEQAGSPWISEFQGVLWNSTMLRSFYSHLVGSQYETSYRRGVLDALDRLKLVPAEPGPKFVFAHILCPHQLFVFGPNGETVKPADYLNYEDKQVYTGQYIFISNQIAKVVDALQKSSKTPPLIIIQSDHGLRPHNPGIVIDTEAWHRILNAMYLPGLDKADLYDSISPVNTFRLIFNHYFNAGFELLKDD